jgi:hypothetical protein
MKIMIIVIVLNIFLVEIIIAQSWQFFEVDEGVKPALKLDSKNIPNISFMLEAQTGYIRHAVFNKSTLIFDISEISIGYFYGPLDLAIDKNDLPHINYHNHTFQDQIHLYLTDTGWIEDRIKDPGHDGWDNSIKIDANNNVHTSSIDPSGFGGDGVEYAYLNGSNWQVEAIGSGPIMYANTTSLAIDKQSNPHITYYDDSTQDLMYATKEMGNWSISIVDSAGNVGQFSSLVLDSLDVPTISYYQHLYDSIGVIKIAVWKNSIWNITNIDSLDHVFIGFSGARNMTSLTLDSQMNPHLTYSDEKILKYTKWDGSNWQREKIVDVSNTSTVLGHLTSLQLDTEGYVHVCYYEVTNKTPLRGIVKYVTNKLITTVEHETNRVWTLDLKQNYPNPFNPSTSIQYAVSNPLRRSGSEASRQFVSLKVYDVLGNEIATLVNEEKAAGTYAIEFNSKDLPSGIYFYQLKAGSFVKTKKMVLLR